MWSQCNGRVITAGCATTGIFSWWRYWWRDQQPDKITAR